MSRRADKDREDPLLFDLPLEPSKGGTGRASRDEERKRAAGRVARSLDEPADFAADLLSDIDAPLDAGKPHLEIVSSQKLPEEAERKRSLVGSRLAAGGADLLIHAAVLVIAVVGCVLMGVRPSLPDWPALTVFVLAFSFLYTVVPLAFWGYTPGMAWARLATQNDDGEPLTFGQTSRRWLGAVLTAIFLGIPLLLFGKRSLSDRLSRSETLALP